MRDSVSHGEWRADAVEQVNVRSKLLTVFEQAKECINSTSPRYRLGTALESQHNAPERVVKLTEFTVRGSNERTHARSESSKQNMNRRKISNSGTGLQEIKSVRVGVEMLG